uniref:hypothetical protein n=1 Tax=Alistipes putredinis TaxID=28117 RepID=UPI003AB4B10C
MLAACITDVLGYVIRPEGMYFLPFILTEVGCLEELLQEGPDGKLVLPVSSSPEIHDDEAASWQSARARNKEPFLWETYFRGSDKRKFARSFWND